MPQHDVFADIRQKIITMEFKPGQDLDENMLVEMYAISRTPIRETLIRLAGEGLVIIKRNRGATVAPLDVATLQAYFEAAGFVTRAVVRLAALRRTEQELEAITAAMHDFEKAMQRADATKMIATNDRFHDSISAASHNKYLYHAYRRLLVDHERVAKMCFTHEIDTADEQTKHTTLRQHRRMLLALKRRDAAAAEQISIEHLDLCRSGLQQLLSQNIEVLSDLELEPAAA
jgi:DNA-binding GntR family transcriptional regulator